MEQMDGYRRFRGSFLVQRDLLMHSNSTGDVHDNWQSISLKNSVNVIIGWKGGRVGNRMDSSVVDTMNYSTKSPGSLYDMKYLPTCLR